MLSVVLDGEKNNIAVAQISMFILPAETSSAYDMMVNDDQ
jgi:hypothetical protein